MIPERSLKEDREEVDSWYRANTCFPWFISNDRINGSIDQSFASTEVLQGLVA